MAALNEPLGSSISDIEARDVASAIAASLDTAQVAPSHVYDAGNWEPMTSEQHRTKRRQMEALDEANELKEFPDFHKAIQASLADSKRTTSSIDAGREPPGKIDHSLAAQHDPWKPVYGAGSAQALSIQRDNMEDKKDLTLIKMQSERSGEEAAPSNTTKSVTSK